MKYNSHTVSLTIKDLIIHPRWLIDEYAKICRNDVWFKPPIAPIMILEMVIINIKVLHWIQYDNTIIGAIFCHVINTKQLIHVDFLITSGNQKWNGAAPIFKNNLDLTIIEGINSVSQFIEYFIWINKIENNSIVDAITWTIKYLIDDSFIIVFLLFVNMGINESKLISSPIQTPNQEFDEMDRIVPIINVDRKRIFIELLVIKKERINTSINGVWTH